MKLVLFEPDNPQNFGRIIRLCVCFGAELHVIQPAGFPLDDKRIRRGSLDYGEQLTMVKHTSWQMFIKTKGHGRLVLATTKGAASLYETRFQKEDWLIFGCESSGVPAEVHQTVDARIRIPMQSAARSLNLSLAAAIVLSEAVRQNIADIG